MFNQNYNAVYFIDVYSSLLEENKQIFKELLNEAVNNCSSINLKNFFSSIKIENNELKIDNFDGSLYSIFINNLKSIHKAFSTDSDLHKYSVKVMNANQNVVQLYNSRLPFLYLLNFINKYADKSKVNDFIKKADIIKEISDKLLNINLTKINNNINNNNINSNNKKNNIKEAYVSKKIDDDIMSAIEKKINNEDTLFYNIYIDETGNLSKKDEKIFAVGGYYIKNIMLDSWFNKCYLKLKDLEEHYFTEDNKYFYDKEKNELERKIYHRNLIDKNLRKEITNDAFNFLKDNDVKFICIYEEKPSKVEFTGKYYVDLLSNLIVKTLNQIIIENNKNIDLSKHKILLTVKIAARTYSDKYDTITYKHKDIMNFLDRIKNKRNIDIVSEFKRLKNQYTDKYRYTEKIHIEPYIKEGIEELAIKYGISSSNIDYEILDLTQADKEADLVFADYFCNLFYHHDEDDSDDKIIYNSFKDMIYKEIEYSSFNDDIDYYFIKRDYYSILDKYIFYKKVVSYYDVGSYKKDHAKVYIDKILNFSKNYSPEKRGRYIIAGLKYLLEKIEYESNSIKNYNEILFMYDSLIEFIKEVNLYDNIDYNKKIKNTLIFMINTEKLAVFNHSENHIKAYEIVKENASYIEDANSIYGFRDRVILFYMLRYVSLWHLYDFEDSISVFDDIQILEAENSELYKTELGKLYGILGQSYIYYYYITNNEENLKSAEKSLLKSIEYLSYDSNEVIREYGYLQNLYIIWEKEDSFYLALNKYLDCIIKENSGKDIFDKIAIYLNMNDKSKNYEFFIIRLLKYCNAFKSEKSDKLSQILIANESNIVYEVIRSEEIADFMKEYNLLYYRVKNIDKGYLKKCFDFIDKKHTDGNEGYFDYLRRLSIYMIEILMDNDSHIDDSLKIMKYLCEASDNYKKVFIDFIDNFNSYTDKKEWALKIRNKLYM